MDAQNPSTRDRIVAASFRLFLQHGFDGTGLSQILKETGLSKGAFYHYFASKEDVYREVVTAFYLAPMQAFDFERLKTEPLRDSRQLLAEAYAQLPGAAEAAGVDMARYFALFFEALSRLETFRDAVRTYYAGLLEGLSARTYAEREVTPETADRHARNLLGHFEGQLFLEAVFGSGNLPTAAKKD